MPLTAPTRTRRSSRTLYGAQRKRLRGKRLLARLWLLSQGLLGLGLCVALLWGIRLAYPLFINAPYFRVHTVDINGLATLSREDITYLLGITADTTLWHLDLPRLGARLEHHPYVKSVRLRREFPNTLRVTLQERRPYLVVSSEQQRMLIDEEGVVLRAYVPEQDPAMPQIILSQQRALEPGMRLRYQEIQRAYELLHTYYASPLAGLLRLASLKVQPSGTSVWRFEQYPFDVRFGDEGMTTQFGRLPLAIRYITQQHLTVRTVDLSYRKRIIITPAS
ncbi:MAG: cell division protein FtsQ/DivIB [Candidatus Tectimicrobiota bacterium]